MCLVAVATIVPAEVDPDSGNANPCLEHLLASQQMDQTTTMYRGASANSRLGTRKSRWELDNGRSVHFKAIDFDTSEPQWDYRTFFARPARRSPYASSSRRWTERRGTRSAFRETGRQNKDQTVL